jgi:hypothetical protein
MQLFATSCYVRESEIFQKIFSFFARAGKVECHDLPFWPASYSDPASHLNDKANFIGVLACRSPQESGWRIFRESFKPAVLALVLWIWGR